MTQPLFLWGAEEIASVMGITRRRAFHLLENGHLPARKVGRTWCADRERLIAFLRGDDEAH